MKQPWKKDIVQEDKQVRRRLSDRVATLTCSEAKVALELLDQLVVCFDPDIIHDFMHWRQDPRLSSMLQIAARLDDDMRDQILFFAEDLFTSEKAAR